MFKILDRHDYTLAVNPKTGETSSDFSRVQAWAMPGGMADAKAAVDKLLGSRPFGLLSHIMMFLRFIFQRAAYPAAKAGGLRGFLGQLISARIPLL